MRVAFGTDEETLLTDGIVALLTERGHDVEIVALGDPWPEAGRRVGEAVGSGRCERGVVCCWTGTGREHRGEQGAGRARGSVHRLRDRCWARAGGTTRTCSRSACG